MEASIPIKEALFPIVHSCVPACFSSETSRASCTDDMQQSSVMSQFLWRLSGSFIQSLGACERVSDGQSCFSPQSDTTGLFVSLKSINLV